MDWTVHLDLSYSGLQKTSDIEPNKAQYLDKMDSLWANPGRHTDHLPKLKVTKTNIHVIFGDPPASPDKEGEAEEGLQDGED